MTPIEELAASAFQLRNPFHLPGLKIGIEPEFGELLADWLEDTARAYPMGRIYGTDLLICSDCCEPVPCEHIKPALAVARAINGQP